MRTRGVDLSTSAKDTGVVSIHWPDSGLATFTRHRGEARKRSGLVEQISKIAGRSGGPSQLDDARREGWIHLPKNELTIASLAS